MKFVEQHVPSSVRADVVQERKARMKEIAEALQKSLKDGNHSSARVWNFNLMKLDHFGRIEPSGHKIDCIRALFDWIFLSEHRNIKIERELIRGLTPLLRKPSQEEKTQIQEILQWRPMVQALYEHHINITKYVGTKVNVEHASSAINLMKEARKYFTSDLNSILDEFLPHITPKDNAKSLQHLSFLCLFLPPIDVTDENSMKTLKIRFIPFVMEAWKWIDNNTSWHSLWMIIIGRIMKHYWKGFGHAPEELFPNEFVMVLCTRQLAVLGISTATTKVLKTLKKPTTIDMLPFIAHQVHKAMHKNFSLFATFMVFHMNDNNNTCSLLQNLFELVRSYYHPSNGGSWTTHLAMLLQKISFYLHERFIGHFFDDQLAPLPEFNLIPLLISISLEAIRGKSQIMEDAGALSLQYLLRIDPSSSSIVLQSIEETLQSSTSPKQAISAIHTLSELCFLLQTPIGCEENPTVDIFLSFMHMILPGIDSNDPSKTKETLRFFYSFFLCIPPRQIQRHGRKEILEAFTFLFIYRLLPFFHTLPKEDAETLHSPLKDCLQSLFIILESNTIVLLLQKSMAYVASQAPVEENGKSFSILFKCLFLSLPDSYDWISIMDTFISNLISDSAATDLHDFSTLTLHWSLQVLHSFLKATPLDVMVSRMGHLKAIFKAALAHTSKTIVKASFPILTTIFDRTSTFYLLSPNVNDMSTMEELIPLWYEPGKHVSLAYELLDEYIMVCDSTLREILQIPCNNNNVSPLFHSELSHREVIERSLLLLQSLLNAGSLLCNTIEHTEKGTRRTFTIGYPHAQSSYSRREKIGNLLEYVGTQSTANTLFSAPLLLLYSQVIDKYLNRSITSMYPRRIQKEKRVHQRVNKEKKKSYPTTIQLDRVEAQWHLRMFCANICVPGPIHDSLIRFQHYLSQSAYIEVRREAQGSMRKIIHFYHELRSSLLHTLLEACTHLHKNSDDSIVKGSLYLLNNSTVLSFLSNSWNFQEKLISKILSLSLLFERSSVQKLIYQILVQFVVETYYPLAGVSSSDVKELNGLLLDKTVISPHWRFLVLQSSLVFAFNARCDIPLGSDVVELFLSSLCSEIFSLRHIAKTALPSLLGLQLELARPVFNSLYRYWSNSLWMDHLFEYMAEDHHIRTEVEEEKQKILPAFLQYNVSLRTKSTIASDILQVLSSGILTTKMQRWPKHRGSFKSYLFDTCNAQLFSQIFSTLSHITWQKITFTPWLERVQIQFQSENRKYQCASAEMISGAIHGLLGKNDGIFSILWKEGVESLLSEVFCGKLGIALDWPTALRFAISDSPPSYEKWIRPLLDGDLSFLSSHTNVSSAKLVRSLLCVRAIQTERSLALQECSEKKSFLTSLLRECLKHSGHSSASVRMEVAQLIHILVVTMIHEIDDDPIFSFLTSDTSQCSDTRETTLLWLTKVFMERDSFPRSSWVVPCFLYVLQAIKDESSQVQSLSRSCLAVMVQSHFEKSTLLQLLSFLRENVLVSLDWHIRLIVPSTIQLIDFNHRFLLDEENHRSFHDVVIKLLSDEQVEVRENAAIALSSLLRGASEEYFISLGERFTKAASVVLRKQDSLKSKRFLVKHGGVLGLCSMLRMYPYQLPTFLVPFLMEIARHNDDPTVISSTVRTAMKDFWRTHQEMWTFHKSTVLSMDQAQILEELLISPSYYA